MNNGLLKGALRTMIKVIARQQKLQFVKDGPIEYRYVLHAENYSKLKEAKVIEEASTHSGIGKGALKGAWDAIGDVIKAWVTEGHSVTISGLGTMRFSLSGKSVADVNDVAASLITGRKVVYTPSAEIKDVLKSTNVSITCIDKDGNVVKRVQDANENEDIDEGDDNTTTGGNTGTGSNTGNGGTTGGGNNDDPDNGME